MSSMADRVARRGRSLQDEIEEAEVMENLDTQDQDQDQEQQQQQQQRSSVTQSSTDVTAAQAAELTAEKMSAPARIDEAITELRKGTMPGDSGVTTDLLATPELRALLVAFRRFVCAQHVLCK